MLAALPVELFLQIVGSSLQYEGIARLADTGITMGALLADMPTTALKL